MNRVSTNTELSNKISKIPEIFLVPFFLVLFAREQDKRNVIESLHMAVEKK